jgi:hypothetical protein
MRVAGLCLIVLRKKSAENNRSTAGPDPGKVANNNWSTDWLIACAELGAPFLRQRIAWKRQVLSRGAGNYRCEA